MTDILIAYNNDYADHAHNMFESCADKARQIAFDHQKSYTLLTTPNLTTDHVMTNIANHHLCVIAAHGDEDGIYNEKWDDVISIHTTNYNCAGKGIYSISCSCAVNLCQHLIQLGAKFFIGYNRPFRFSGAEPYAEIAMSGLEALLKGKDLEDAHQEMLNKYDAMIANTDPHSVVNLILVHNKESLVFAGDNHCRYEDLT